LQAIWGAFSDNTSVKLAGWIVIAGICFGLFAFVVPNLHALRFFSSCSLLLSLIYTCIAIAIAFSDGMYVVLAPLSLSLWTSLSVLLHVETTFWLFGFLTFLS
jgi:hypothetical protein